MKIEVWSDIVCPWCYVGKRRFERALAEFPQRDQVQVVHRSFQLDPTTPPGQTRSRNEMLRTKYGWSDAQSEARHLQMQATAAAEGLDFQLGDVQTGNTAAAHQLVHLGKAHGRQDAVLERLYRAYFTERRSLFERDSLVALAAEAGLDADEARRVLEQDTYAGAVAADGRAAHALGANGVPFFVIDERYGVSGAQPTDLFKEVLARAWAEAHPAQPEVIADAISPAAAGTDVGEQCADESCALPPVERAAR